MTHTVLLVEDDVNILKINKNVLSRAGYRILTAENLREAEAIINEETPDAIVLDIMLPDGNGIDWCRHIRGESQVPPILFLSAKKDAGDILQGLKAGGDDYLTKPYDFEELTDRVARLLTKASRVPPTVKKGAVRLEIPSQRAFLNDEDMGLSVKEFSLLLYLLQHEGKVIKAEDLYRSVWGQGLNENSQALRTAVSRLRTKMDGSGLIIDYEWDEGYRLTFVK